MSDQYLIIMRHAKSDWTNAVNDFQRPLAQRGIEAIQKMAAWLKRNELLPDRIIASPAVRARQTAELLLEKLDSDADEIIWDKNIYEADLFHLQKSINTYSSDAHCLLLIGHNPGLDTLLCHLSKKTPRGNNDNKLLTTAALAVLGYGPEGINTERGQAELLHLVRPKEL